MGLLLGIPLNRMPVDYPGFVTYLEKMRSEGTLVVGAEAQEVADALLHRSWTGRIVRAASFVSIGLLPGSLREAYGLTWNEARQARLLKLAAKCRRVRPRLPLLFCINPHAWLAELRCTLRREAA